MSLLPTVQGEAHFYLTLTCFTVITPALQGRWLRLRPVNVQISIILYL